VAEERRCAKLRAITRIRGAVIGPRPRGLHASPVGRAVSSRRCGRQMAIMIGARGRKHTGDDSSRRRWAPCRPLLGHVPRSCPADDRAARPPIGASKKPPRGSHAAVARPHRPRLVATRHFHLGLHSCVSCGRHGGARRLDRRLLEAVSVCTRHWHAHRRGPQWHGVDHCRVQSLP